MVAAVGRLEHPLPPMYTVLGCVRREEERRRPVEAITARANRRRARANRRRALRVISRRLRLRRVAARDDHRVLEDARPVATAAAHDDCVRASCAMLRRDALPPCDSL